ncbi:unnamed protein product [Medioppia subpectinata]|uniref:Sas10 C-terminal domain-containing protein n=1 Tax=Medioppia subpectinata TaxID=1979941 RepID=A0A7R9L5T0_9ACAR|nr:unnamed protein product [Medioppia subpectinata]CAG2115041.1 unnamed protein product [Medioppia subpectinata]
MTRKRVNSGDKSREKRTRSQSCHKCFGIKGIKGCAKCNKRSKTTASDSDSGDDFEDDMNDFHAKKDKQLLKRSALSQDIDSDDEDAYGSDEEVMPFDESSDSDPEMDRFGIELKKDEMASDLEDSDDETVDTTATAWGKEKKVFYNTDYVDKDFRKYNQKDSDLAQFEEEEALQIQKRLLESINESDVGLDLLVGDIEPKTGSTDWTHEEKEEEKLHINLSNLTKRQKLEILKKESPELEPLITDFQTYMTEIKDRLLPVMEAIKDKKISVKEHPVLKQMLSFKKLLNEMNSIQSSNTSIDRDIDSVLEKLNSKKDIKFFRKHTKKQKTSEIEKRVSFADDMAVRETTAPEGQQEVMSETDEAAKRGITYEMAKNKGLTPKRKKELKNPRVKHRMKYRKAQIRRKGQVREPRKELQRYGGEMSGIKSGVVKSVRFK